MSCMHVLQDQKEIIRDVAEIFSQGSNQCLEN